jgi:hypothetical protein
MNQSIYLAFFFLSFTAVALADHPRIEIQGDQITFNGAPVKVLGLRCSNALMSDQTTNELIASLDLYQSFGINLVSVFVMGSRFGDVKGYLPDGTMNSVYQKRLERILEATRSKKMMMIVGCLYWSTSAAKEELEGWTQTDADTAIANTARWLGEKGYYHVILDPDNEGMATRAMKWEAESMIRSAKQTNPDLVVANNTKQDPPNEDLNMHFGNPESGKPWFDSEATPKNAPGGYWNRFSKETTQQDETYYNYSRIGRYTLEMKKDQLNQTREGMEKYNGHVLASTWLQCAGTEGVQGPFTKPGGYSNLGSNKDIHAAWNKDLDSIHPDAGILWWLEFIRKNYHTN